MHPRVIITLQTATTAAAILITYMVFIQPRRPRPPTRHSTPKVLVPRPRDSGLNLTELIGCEDGVPDVHICIFAKDPKRTQRLIRTLNTAGYGLAKVTLTIAGNNESVPSQKPLDLTDWTHDGYKFATESVEQMYAPQQSSATVVIALDDSMEPSPLHALWFLIQYCQTNATAIAGGRGDKNNEVAGLAMDSDVWNGFVKSHPNKTAPSDLAIESIMDYFNQMTPNTSSIIFPSGGHTFVRAEWQNPAYVEHAPKLTRAWNPAKEPSWGAVEIRI